MRIWRVFPLSDSGLRRRFEMSVEGTPTNTTALFPNLGRERPKSGQGNFLWLLLSTSELMPPSFPLSVRDPLKGSNSFCRARCFWRAFWHWCLCLRPVSLEGRSQCFTIDGIWFDIFWQNVRGEKEFFFYYFKTPTASNPN